MKNVKIWITVRMHEDAEEIKAFDTHDDIFGLYDFVECHEVSETTYNRLKEDSVYPVRYGNSIRARQY